jgi:hypothetical protein
VSLSGECFEHDPHWRETFLNMVRMTRPEGLVVFTCASGGRPEHGTSRTNQMLSPGTQARGMDYYRNLSSRDFMNAIQLNDLFTEYRFWYMPTSFDLYFVGVRAGATTKSSGATGRLPDAGAVARLRSLMPLRHRVARLPLRIMASATSDARFQSIALPYWRIVLGVASRIPAIRSGSVGSSH